MKYTLRALCLILALSLVLPLGVSAQTPDSDWDLPFAPDFRMVESTQEEMETRADVLFLPMSSAAASVRQNMMNRMTRFSVGVYVNENTMTQARIQEIANELFYLAASHCNLPQAGDYLVLHLLTAAEPRGSVAAMDPMRTSLIVSFEFTYRTDAAQEAQVDEAVAQILREQIQPGMTENEKIRAIYTYLTSHVTYAESSDPMRFAAYGALINGSAVCQGFASAFYRLAMAAGVDSRVLVGTGNGGAHAWNLVRQKGINYLVDATWDAQRTQAGQQWSYYLKSESTFSRDHTRDESMNTQAFHSAYPVSPLDYPRDILDYGYCGAHMSWNLTSDYTLNIAGSGDMYALTNQRLWHDYAPRIQQVTLEGGNIALSDRAFAGHTALTELTLPDSVVSIGNEAFAGCTGLETLYIQGDAPAFAANAFARLTARVVYDCAQPGWIQATASRYGGNITWDGGHELGEPVVTPPTCTEEGNTSACCSICGQSFATDITPATGHTYTDHTVAATCTQGGYTTHTCACGDSYVDGLTEAVGHNYESVVTEPTWGAQGYTTYTCALCGDSYQDDFVPALPAEAAIGQQYYETLTQALAEAQSGDTVTLMADVDAAGETLILRPGVTLHLGAYDLIADGFIGFNGSILDATRYSATGDYGKLIVPKENLVLSGGQAAVNGEYDVIPVWNGEDAYILANALVNDTEGEYGLKIDEENKTIRFSFVHKVGGSANNAFFKDGTGDNALKIIIRLEWASGNGVAYQDFVYNDDFVGLVSGGGYNYSFVLNNYDILNIDLSNLKVTAMILTDAGTITTGQAWTQANAIE